MAAWPGNPAVPDRRSVSWPLSQTVTVGLSAAFGHGSPAWPSWWPPWWPPLRCQCGSSTLGPLDYYNFPAMSTQYYGRLPVSRAPAAPPGPPADCLPVGLTRDNLAVGNDGPTHNWPVSLSVCASITGRMRLVSVLALARYGTLAEFESDSESESECASLPSLTRTRPGFRLGITGTARVSESQAWSRCRSNESVQVQVNPTSEAWSLPLHKGLCATSETWMGEVQTLDQRWLQLSELVWGRKALEPISTHY